MVRQLDDHVRKIRAYKSLDALSRLWEEIKARRTSDWPHGLAFEFMILRAFELEGAVVQWPYSVELHGVQVEQLDGLVFLPEYRIHVLVESKDWQSPLPISPIAKVRNQLQRRPSSLIAAIFASSDFSDPALLLANFMSRDTILLWNQQDIDFCFQNSYFSKGMWRKFEYALAHGVSTVQLSSEALV